MVDQAMLGADGGGMGADHAVDQRGTQFVALVEDPARDGCHWVALLDGRVADVISGGEWLPVADCEWLIRSIWRIEPG
jgi:hypothetical protein